MTHHKLASIVINTLMLGSMLLGLVAPAAQWGLSIAAAQEAIEEVTEEPAPPVTESSTPTQPAATDTPPPTATVPPEQPTEPTAEQTSEVAPAPETTEVIAPTSESTEAVTPESTEAVDPETTATVVPTDEATATDLPPTLVPPPTVDPSLRVFEDNFEDGNTDGWTLSPGWALFASNGNLLLQGVIPGAAAEINGIDWPHLNVQARVRVQPGSTLEFLVRHSEAESYRVALDSAGMATLYRDDTLLAQGTAAEAEEADPEQAVWRTVVVQALGSQLVVSVDEVIQFGYEDPTPLTAGGIAFVAGAENTGAVSLDDVVINRLEAPVIVTPPAPEVTEEATAEVTQEAEVTEEPEATDEPAPEATEAVEPEQVAVPVLAADFEGELAGWVASEGAVIVAVTDDNKALLFNSGDSLIPASITELADLRLDAKVSFLSEGTGGLNIIFRNRDGSHYLVTFELAQTTLYRGGPDGLVPLLNVPAARTPNTWFDLRLEAVGSQISLIVDGVAEFSHTDEAALTSGEIALMANGEASFFLDDLTVYELLSQDQLPIPTPLPVVTLTEETSLKLSDALYQVLSLYEQGDEAGALALANSLNVTILDEALNVEVVVWPTETLDTLMPVVEFNGGVTTAINEKNLNVRIPLQNLIPLVHAAEVRAVFLPEVATSTDFSPAAALAPAQQEDDLPHSLGIIGWNDWNLDSITGAGVKIGVIDSAGTHRNAVVSLIKTIAPGATVNTYNAGNTAQLASALNSAKNANDIILITLDLGAHVSPGDGTGSAGTGQGDANLVYTRIQEARQAGKLVIVSAGNNTGSYASFEYTNAATTVQMEVEQGDFYINVGWSDWGGSANLRSSVSGTGISTVNSPGNRPDKPGYQLTGECTQDTCDVTLDFGGFGNTTGFYVQVQLASPGSITGVTGSTIDSSAGNIGRPADSPYALTVGAVCAAQNDGYFPPMFNSSHGPIFASGGTGPGPDSLTNTRQDYKPDLVGPSHVYSPQYGAPNTEEESCASYGEVTTGFNGTSAAASHIAGMAALLLSNDTMASHIKNAPNRADALQNYLQTHSIDLFQPAADAFAGGYGFDNVYGAGLPTLGNPAYDLSRVSNPVNIGEPNTLYVGQAKPGSAQEGTASNPFIHIARAIEAADNSASNRIVVLPGEYPSGIGIVGRSDIVLEGYNGQATIWVNSSYYGQAGINVEDSTGIIIDNLEFLSANPISVAGSYDIFQRPTGLQFRGTTPVSSGGSIVRNSIFRTFTGSLPLVIDAAYGVQVQDNIFEDLSSAGLFSHTAMRIQNADSATERVMLRGNTFRDITGLSGFLSTRVASIRIENSAVDAFGNLFQSNNVGAIFTIINDNADGSNAVNIFSNVFINNFNLVAHLSPAPQVRFVNNTVVNQSNISGDHTTLLLRTTSSEVDYPWAVHNNLFYNNPGYRVALHRIVSQNQDNPFFSVCAALDNASPDTGVRNNWIIGTQTGFGTNTCDISISSDGNPQNNNMILPDTIDPALLFMGADPLLALNPNSDPFYYQLLQGVDGIDAGDVSVLMPPLVDFAGSTRSSDGDGDSIELPDVGAFELVPLTAEPVTVFRMEDELQTGTAFTIDLREGVDGGYKPYVFKIKTPPANFSTDPADSCQGNGLLIQGYLAYYCPPQHFYTDNANPAVPDNVQFEYYVFDQLSNQNDLENAVHETITINIAPQTDTPLTTPVNYQFVAEAGEEVKFRLRPWVRFNNFRFSEAGTERSSEADYPFTYGNVQINEPDDPEYNPGIVDDGGSGLQAYLANQISNPNPDGTITLQTINGERGFIEFTYDVTDANSSTITNTIRVEVKGYLPDRGLHDDSSFSFRYGTLGGGADGWQAVASTANINNTLHQTRNVNDVATFDFVGESFVIYMQAMRSGALWELRVDDPEGIRPALTWVQQADGSWKAAADGFNCVTRAPVSNNLISNNGTNAYTVSCDGLRGDESHSVQMINRQNKKWLAVDAFAILFDGDPLLPGVHEVTEHDLFTLFAGWNVVQDKAASGGLALAAPSDQISDVTFRFSGTGFALNTTLEGAKNGSVYNGADYDICITPRINGADGEEVCQTFDNGLGAAKKPTWNVYRPFFGYQYNPLAAAPDSHRVRIHIRDIPNGARFVIDDIVVFGDRPTAPLSLSDHITEDDEIGPIVFGNGLPASWTLNTNDRKASNKSLTSLARGIVAAGPFVGFQVPDATDMIHWYRLPGKRDSQSVLVCVDRGQGEASITQLCQEHNLRTAPNPLVIRETDFADGWGTAWSDDAVHTVEIFSLTNEVFNVDKIEIFDNDAPLTAGYYEDLVLAGNNGSFGFFDSSETLNGGSFAIVQDKTTKKASGTSVARTNVAGEGVLFQMTGTGFTTYFTQDRNAGDVQICWLPGVLTTSVDEVENAQNCRIYTNYNRKAVYQAGYTVLGLPQGSHTVVIRNLQNSGTGTRQMQFDAVLVIDDPLPTNVLTAEYDRYETNFANSADADTFLYYGNWQTVEGKKAKKFSGENYDQIRNGMGAGLVFQTQGIDTLRIVRTAKRGFADIQVCVDGTGNCLLIPGDRDPAVVHLSSLVDGPFSMVDPHVVSILLANGGQLQLDAIDVFDSSTALLPGLYEEDHPLLKYDSAWNNKTSGSYTNRRGQRTVTQDGTLLFHMTGSILELGTFLKSYEQVEICYVTGIVLDPEAVDQNCQTFPQSGQSLKGRQVYMSAPFVNGVDTYTVRVRNQTAAELIVDYVHIIDHLNPLIEGRYENDHPVILANLNDDSAWETRTDRSTTDGDYLRTQTAGEFVEFQIEGTGFGIGTFADRFGSEMLVCYTPSGDPEQCVTFQNEAARTSKTITRAITGLPRAVYTVRIQNLDDGMSDLSDPPVARASNYPATLVIDFVEVYDGLPAPLIDGGTYNDDATDANGVAYVQLLPADAWNIFTDRSANNATEGSYASVIDSRSRVTTAYAGQTATFQVQLPANSTSTLILDLMATHNKNSDQLQYCIVGGTAETDIVCQTLTTAQSERYQAITLENTGGTEDTRTISFSNLTPGYLRIDGLQFIPGDILGGGLYEDALMNSTAIFDTSASTGWETITHRSYSNGSAQQTAVADDMLQFSFAGTGFSIGTHTGPNAADMEICYQTAAVFDGDWADGDDTCVTFSNRISKGSTNISRSIAGLTPDTYVVGVFNRDDGLADPSLPPTLTFEYVEVFDAPLPPALGTAASGGYNEDATNNDGDPYLQFLPASRWASVTGKAAQNATDGSYASVVDTRGRDSSAYAGPLALLRVQVPAGELATITLDTFAAGRGSSDQLQYCIVGGASALDIHCDVLNTMPDSRFQVVTIDNSSLGETTYSIFFQTLTPGYLRVDRFQLLQGNTLGAGIYEDVYVAAGGLLDAVGTGWSPISHKSYSNGTAWQTTNSGDSLQFEFYGTGFAVGTPVGRTGSEMQLCYTRSGGTEQCLDFQNEINKTSTNVTRSVVGLPEDLYVVSVRHLDDGQTNIPSTPGPRSSKYPATLIVDYVQVFNEPGPATISMNGTFNEDATDGSAPYIQLLPADRWLQVTGKGAKGATEESYSGVMDTRNRVSAAYAGPTAMMRVEVAAQSSLTLALNTYQAGKNHSDQLQYCILNEDVVVECGTLNTMSINPNQIVTIENPGLSAGEFTVFFQTLTPGFFRIDGFQTILDGVLTEGLYDNHLMQEDGLIDIDSNWQLPPTKGTKVKGTFGGEVIRTQTQGAELNFTFSGSGFSIITVESTNRLGIEVCIESQAGFELDGFEPEDCQLNYPEVGKGNFPQYGLNFYGLTPDTYVARVRVDQPVTNAKKQWFQVDAIAIFGDYTSAGALQPGIYDDADLLEHAAVRFAPAVFWSSPAKIKSGPPKGPWQLTEQQATNSGAVLQVFVEGNVLTLYQQIHKKSSSEVQVCLVVYGTEGNELECGTFSQSGKGSYFTPIAFYGLGDGTHQIIFENKTPKARFNVDGLQVTP